MSGSPPTGDAGAQGLDIGTLRAQIPVQATDQSGDPDDRALDRHHLRVVAMEPAIGPALDRFHEALSVDTTRSRFLGVHPHLSPAELMRFTHVDHDEREALVVVDPQGEVVAVGRFDRLPDQPSHAEVAFVVADAWQHRGVGSALFTRLTARACELGVTRLVADTLASNRAMRTVFRHGGHPVREDLGAGVVTVTIELTPS
ncbi:MAG: GNAT family N-acetyltransferase [Ilumatobacteraceae bacterium]